MTRPYRDLGYEMVRGVMRPQAANMMLHHLTAEQGIFRLPERKELPDGFTTHTTYEVHSLRSNILRGLSFGLTPMMREISGIDLLPSYSYFRIYRRDDRLNVHLDRQACEHSISLTLGYSDDIEWPLEIGSTKSTAKNATRTPDFGGAAYEVMVSGIGDAIAYKGCEHYHGRMMPNPNRWSAHVFLHWVDPDGPYADHAFDMHQHQHATSRKADFR